MGGFILLLLIPWLSLFVIKWLHFPLPVETCSRFLWMVYPTLILACNLAVCLLRDKLPAGDPA
jgi:hypothetical protein